MRTKAFGEEPPGSLLSSEEVARASLATLVSGETGHIVDIRREDPLALSVPEDTDLSAALTDL
jgi:2-C-methyl-D-erythritol 4-phosphate cytidylyltransferase